MTSYPTYCLNLHFQIFNVMFALGQKRKITFYLQVSFLKVFKAMCEFESLCLSLYISRQSQNSLEIELRRLATSTYIYHAAP